MAWQNYLDWRMQPEIEFVPEPPGIEAVITDWYRSGLATAKNWTDLYLAAFALTAGLRLVTFDSDFQKLPGIELLHLKL
jgi:predicted nucleic acid-binding protein